MPEDATLDAFASPDATESDGDGEPASDDEPADDELAEIDAEPADDEPADVEGSPEDTDTSRENVAESPENIDVDPARSTYEWTPEGGECADCGTSAERRWRRDGQTDGELVCEDCKEW